MRYQIVRDVVFLFLLAIVAIALIDAQVTSFSVFVQTWTPTFGSLVTTGAILVGGAWTYMLFVKRRQRLPKATLKQSATCVRLQDGRQLLRVDAIVSNAGDVLLQLESVQTRLQQLLPMPDDESLKETIYSWEQSWKDADPDTQVDQDTEIGWPEHIRCTTFPKGSTEVEPGESHSLRSDFLLDREVQVVCLYTHVSNIAKPRPSIGWDQQTTLDLNEIAVPKRTTSIASKKPLRHSHAMRPRRYWRY